MKKWTGCYCNLGKKFKIEKEKIYLTSLMVILIFLFAFIVQMFLIYGREVSKIIPFLKIGTPDGWLGFFGSIFGIIATFLIFLYTVKLEEKNRRIDKFEESFAYISLVKIIESNETIGAGDNLIFDHFIVLKNTSDVPIIDLNLNLEKSYFSFIKENDDFELKKIIYLKELQPIYIKENLYIPPNTEYKYTLRHMVNNQDLEKKLGLWKGREVELSDFQLILFFDYKGKYSRYNKKASYIIEIERHQMILEEFGLMRFLTNEQFETNWTNLFIGNITQRIEIPVLK